MKKLVSGLCLSLLLGAQATWAGDEDLAEADVKAEAVFKQLDWSKPAVVEMTLEDHNFEPSEITLPLNKPVVLRLKNTGKVNHDMVGGSFFQAVLVKSITTSVGRVYATHVRAVDVRAKQDAEIWLVPTKPGKYTFYCSIEGHREDGMEGIVIIQ